MGTLLRTLGSGLAYFCVATLLAQGAVLGYLWSNGSLDGPRISQIGRVVRGETSAAPGPEKHAAEAPGVSVTLADIDAARALRLRQFELREQAAQNVLQQVRFETKELTDNKVRFDRIYDAFKEQLGRDKVSALARGNENARLLLESVKPKQSKELIMEMLNVDEIDAVVTMLEAMPIAKRAKIAAEFKTVEETKKLDEILRRIRRGLPDSAIIDETQRALEQTADKP